MTEDPVTKLANDWYEAAQERGHPIDGYNAIRGPLRDFVPPEALAGIAYRKAVPVVIAAIPGRLICISVRPGGEEEDEHVAELTSLPLASAVEVSVHSRLEDSAASRFVVRTWTLRVPGLDPWTLITRSPTANSLAEDHGGEAAVAAVLAQLGWQLPGQSG